MKHINIINNKILAYYKDNKRPLPWRTSQDNNQNPYFTLVSEIMLQQTQVKTALSYYKRFIKKWPTIEKLAYADLDEVLVMWSGLGYYNRAKNLLKTAKIVLKKYNKVIPSNRDSLLNLPGIGEYTAAAIRSFAFGKHEVALDTNVKRFIVRVYGLDDSILANYKKIAFYGLKVFPKNNSGRFAQAVMDFSSAVCTKVNPSCQNCFLRKNCKYSEKSIVNSRKLSSKRVKKKYSIVQLYLFKKKYFFLKKRPLHKMLGGLYEVPGSKWKVDAWPDFPKNFKEKHFIPGIINYKFSHFELKTRVIIIHLRIKNLEQQEGKWVSQEDLNQIPVSTLTKRIIAHSLKYVAL